MKSKNIILEYKTKGEYDFIDITEKVLSFVKESQINAGLVNIQTLHTTASLLLNEKEPLLIEDIKRNLDRLAPKNIKYEHDDFTKRTINMCDDECVNGHAHCKALYLPVNITLNLVDGKLQLGQWQRIFFIELDKARPRKVQVHIIGE